MTNKNKKVFAVGFLILALTIFGCNIPTATLIGNQPGAAYTQAAQTIVAQLTYSVVETFIAQKTQEANLALTPQIPTSTPTQAPTSTNTPTAIPPIPCENPGSTDCHTKTHPM